MEWKKGNEEEKLAESPRMTIYLSKISPWESSELKMSTHPSQERYKNYGLTLNILIES